MRLDRPVPGCLPGAVIERGHRARAELRAALVREVRRLAEGRSHEPVPDGIGVEFTRTDNLWATHQRIHQFQGPHNETWGGVTFNIDSSRADGPVADD